jgi:ribonuclease BN (tRNA processing enzyme)
VIEGKISLHPLDTSSANVARPHAGSRQDTDDPLDRRIVDTWLLPHFVPNAGVRLTANGQTLTYTGDTGPSRDLLSLARDADLFLTEATYAERVPTSAARYLSSARQAGQQAARAGVAHLLLTHLWPGSDLSAAEEAARRAYRGNVSVARGGMCIDLD